MILCAGGAGANLAHIAVSKRVDQSTGQQGVASGREDLIVRLLYRGSAQAL